MGIVSNFQTSLRLTGASFRLIFRKPVVMALPLLTLAWTTLLVLAPTNFFVWLEQNHPDASHNFWKGVFFVTVSAFEAHNYQWAFTSAILTGYVIWAIWMTFFLWGALFVITVGMDMATQQIRTRNAALPAAFRLAARNLGRLFLLALVLATLVAWFRYFTTFVLRLIPFAGRWLNRAFRLLLTAVTYLMLPIIVYERAGTISALKSAWTNVRKTWTGLILGSSTMFVGIWVLSSIFASALFDNALGLKGWTAILPSLILGAIIFSFASSLAAAMRATLYWYATTGEVPEGFNKEDLPTIATHQPFTTLAATGMLVTPTASQASRPPQPAAAARLDPMRRAATPATAKTAPSWPTVQKVSCPRCKTIVEAASGQKPVCPKCGFGK